MAPVHNGRLIFKKAPTDYPEPGKHTIYDDSESIDIDTVPLNGGLLIKTIALSVDPYMRGRMKDPEDTRSYKNGFTLGQPLDNQGIGIVLRSEHSGIRAGQKVFGVLPYQQYTVLQDINSLRIIENHEGLPWTAYLGIIGMPGQTAYYAWKEYASPKKGEVAFITAAAGPVGSLAVQLAKADGLKVIASAGSDEKVDFIKSLGADVVFNYKSTKTEDVLAKEGPVDVYWDNVGGETLDAALLHAAQKARFIECGMISGYNGQSIPVYNLANVVWREIKFYGFLHASLSPKFEEEFYVEIPKRVKSGELKYKEDITKGLEKGMHALLDVLHGKNQGKSVVVVAEDEL